MISLTFLTLAFIERRLSKYGAYMSTNIDPGPAILVAVVDLYLLALLIWWLI